jgi:hypothetical protein
MTNSLKISIFAAMIFCSTAAWSQTEDNTSKEVFKKITDALVKGDCDRAQRNYHIWKTLTEQTNPDIEAEIKECSTSKEEAKKEYVELTNAGIAVAKENATSSEINWESAKSLCDNSILGDYTDWRLPTQNELATIFTNKKEIGIFPGTYYWSSSAISRSYRNFSGPYYNSPVITSNSPFIINMTSGQQTRTTEDSNQNCRCVRTLP